MVSVLGVHTSCLVTWTLREMHMRVCICKCMYIDMCRYLIIYHDKDNYSTATDM